MEELKLYEGRPADCTGRLEKEIRTYDLLDKLGIQFWRTDHGWMKADTMEDCHVDVYKRQYTYSIFLILAVHA